MATMELSGDLLGGYAIVIYAGLGSALSFSLVTGRLFRLDRSVWTSALTLILVTHISVVSLMLLILRGADGNGVFAAIVRDLARNPLLIAVVLGMAVYLAAIDDIPVLYDMTKILGAAALTIVLLCVGANIRVRAMAAAALPIWLSIAGKMVIFPLLVGVVALAIGLDPLATMIAMIFGAVPSAASAYTLARQMRGDAPTMAAIVTIQTATSFVTLALTLMLAQHWLAI